MRIEMILLTRVNQVKACLVTGIPSGLRKDVRSHNPMNERDPMKIKLLVAALIAGVSLMAQAQTAAPAAKASDSKTRAEVKEEAKA